MRRHRLGAQIAAEHMRVVVREQNELARTQVNALCMAVLIARVCQSLVHVSHVQTDAFVAVRFSFFSVQLICFLALIVMSGS